MGRPAFCLRHRHELPASRTARWNISCPPDPFARLPHGRQRAAHRTYQPIVWTERTPTAERLLAAWRHRLPRELGRRKWATHLGAVRLLGRRWSYPLSAMVVERYPDTRLALVGDAAHGNPSIAGQGLNLGFRDIGALAELVIAAAHNGEDVGAPDLLAATRRDAARTTWLMLAATECLDRLFSSDNPVLRLARDFGLAVHAFPCAHEHAPRPWRQMDGQCPNSRASRSTGLSLLNSGPAHRVAASISMLSGRRRACSGRASRARRHPRRYVRPR